MRRLLLVLAIMAVASTANAQLIITGVFDGTLSGGLPKGVELFVCSYIPDLSAFGLGSANNGGGSDGEEFTFPAVSVAGGTFIYVASEDVGFQSWFGFAPDYVSAAMSINGDDAIELFALGQIFDTFGDIETDGTGSAWEYSNGWAKRNSAAGPDGAAFLIDGWSFSGLNGLEGGSDNATADKPFPMGNYMCDPAVPTENTAWGYLKSLYR